MSPAGRPPLDEEERKGGQVRVLLTPADKDTLDRAAATEGKRTGAWLREVGLAAAEQILAASQAKPAGKKKKAAKKKS